MGSGAEDGVEVEAGGDVGHHPKVAGVGAFEGGVVGASGPEPPFVQDLPEDARSVRHDAVHSEFDQALHLHGVVDGPDVYLEFPVVCRSDEPSVDEADAVRSDRDL